MTGRPKKWLPEWVTEFGDRHGKRRYRFRRKGFRQYLFKAKPGTPEFIAEYRACLDGIAAEIVMPGADRHRQGSFDDLISRYYRSPDFADPGERTRTVYRGVIERWRNLKGRDGRRYGEAMVRDLRASHVELMMTAMLPHRTAANMLRKRLSALMRFAVRIDLARENPVAATRPYKVAGDGFHPWTEDEIAKYEATHAIGTMARLAFDLMLWTGQRGGDARLIGPQHVRDNRLFVTQEKTGVSVSLPMLAPLRLSIASAASGEMVFVIGNHGKPFTRKGFGNKMRQWCDEAGLPHCASHGLRKAAARRFAEAGCSNQQIKSWTGHTTDSEVSRYTASADQRLLSDQASKLLMANLGTGLAIVASKTLKSKE